MSYQIEALRDISQDQRKHMPEEDFAGKGRSFPIEKQEDVDAAVDSLGRAGANNYDGDTIKSNIKSIAKRKGLKLPEAWTVEACDALPAVAMSEKGPRFAVRLGATLERIKRVPIAILGRFQKGAQKFAITREILSDMVANFRKRVAATVIDYEHASCEPEIAQGQPIPAAGWIEELDDAPDSSGVLWGTARFTERAVQMLAADELRYFSPVIEYSRDKTTGASQGATLLAGALTLRPFLDGMPAVALSDWQTGSAAATRTEKETKRVTVKTLVLTDRVAGRVKVTFDDGTENTVNLEGLEAQPQVIRLSDVARTDGRYDFAGLPQEGDVLISSEVIHAMTVDRELEAAVQAGKITPAQRPQFEKLALSDLPAFRELAKTLPVQVRQGEMGVGGSGDERDEFTRAKAAVDSEIATLIASEKTLSYAQAWKRLPKGLVATYNAAAAKRFAKKEEN